MVDLTTEKTINTFNYHTWIKYIVFNSKGTQLAIGYDKTIKVIDVKNDYKILYEGYDKYGFKFPMFSPDGTIFAYFKGDICHLHNTESFQLLGTVNAQYDIRSAVFTCGNAMVCRGIDTITVWSPWCWTKWLDRTNYLFPSSIKTVIFTMVCIYHRLKNRESISSVPKLPMQLWLNIMEYL